MTSGSPTPGRSRRAALIALRTWLLPVALGAAAFGLHYALHVPAGPLPPPSPAEIEEKKKAADKKKKDDEKKQKEADKKAGKVSPAPQRGGPRDLPYEPFSRARDRYLLDQLWAYYEPTAFSKEPTFEAWQTAHKPILSQIVSATRQVVFADGPAISVAASECHTIRCRFTITAPTTEPLEQMSAALAELRLGDGSLWHSFKPGKVVEEPSKREGVAAKQKLEFTVSFMHDLPALASIEVPGKGRLRLPQPPPRPPTTTTGPQPGSASAPAIPATGTTTSTASPASPASPASTTSTDRPKRTGREGSKSAPTSGPTPK